MPKKSSITLDSISDDQIVDTIVDLYRYSESEYSEFYELFDYLEELYRVRLPREFKNELPEENPALVPADMFAGIQEIVATLDDTLFSASPVFRLKPISKRTPQDNIRYATSGLDWAVQKSSLRVEFARTLYSAAKLAASVGYVDVEEHRDVRFDLKTPSPESSETGRIITSPGFRTGKPYLCPVYRHLQLTSFFPEPSIPKPSWGIYRGLSSFVDVLMDKEEDRYERVTVKEIEELKGTFPGGEYLVDQGYKGQLMKDNFGIELLHFRGWLPLVDQKNENRVSFADAVATVANRKLLLQCELNQWHYPAAESWILTYLLLSDREEFFPVGKLEASKDTFLHQFYLRNQRLMNVDFLLGPQWLTDMQNMPEYLPAESGRIHYVPDIKKLERIELGDVSNKSYLEVDVEKDEIRHILGSNQWSQGRDPRRRETAYGISKLTEATDTQRKFENQIIAHTGLLRVGQRYMELLQENFAGGEIPMFDTGEIVQIGRRGLVGDFAVGLDLNSPFAKPVQRQEILQAVQLYQNDPMVDGVELRRRHFEIMEFQEVEKLVPDPKEKVLPIEKENMFMVQTGQVYPVLPEEPHDLHIRTHMQYKDAPAVARHIEMHVAAMQAAQAPGSTGKEPRIPLAENEVDLIKQISQRLEPSRI